MRIRPGIPEEREGIACVGGDKVLADRRRLVACDIGCAEAVWLNESEILVESIPTCRGGGGARGIVIPDRVGSRSPCSAVDFDAADEAMGRSQLR